MGDRGLGGAGAPEAPETGCEALLPDPSSRPDGARGGPRTPLTWSSRNSNRWALKLSIWKSQFCIKPSKLPSSTSTRSPSSRPWSSRSQLRALRAAERRGAGLGPQSNAQRRRRPQAAPGRAEQLQRLPRRGRSLGALRARGGSAGAGRGGAAGSGLRVAAPDAARPAGSRAAPGCRARAVGRARGRDTKTETTRGRRAVRPEQGRFAL